MRNAKLLKLKTETWAAEADSALINLASILKLDVVESVQEQLSSTNIFDDSGDEGDSMDDFQIQQSQNSNNSIESEIKSFLSQSPDHFVKCKFNPSQIVYHTFLKFAKNIILT